jgi:hypothetical protein
MQTTRAQGLKNSERSGKNSLIAAGDDFHPINPQKVYTVIVPAKTWHRAEQYPRT